ncbi:hypothetical protein ACFSR7_30220 [Cohnella sp. GCM10020058]|uniref:hypothetical protein n=1 Tax=Cohnella sp. GCM10020058 TaxID=3317330 RepID=UPI003636E9BA
MKITPIVKHAGYGQTWMGLDKIVVINMQSDSSYMKEYLSNDKSLHLYMYFLPTRHSRWNACKCAGKCKT